VKKWFLELRPQFLILAILLVAHGSALAFWQIRETGTGEFSVVNALLAMAGLFLLHGSVNALNDWHDWEKSGIDKVIRQTPFSGGSGLVPQGVLTASGALTTGLVTLVVGSIIGLYLAWVAGWPLLVIGAVGVSSIVLYTPFWTRIGLGELWAGLGLGLLPLLGTYYLLAGHLDAVAWVSGLAAYFLTYNLLFLNEFPDAEADVQGGRKHLVIRMGKRNARVLYAIVELAAFATIVAGVVFGLLTPWALLGLIALVPGLKAIQVLWSNYDGFEQLFPAMGMNVFAVLGLNLFLAVGYLIAALTTK
jgi:1,4-dihydroxy-2-naphthoate octaprenyltransferase